MSAGTPGWLSRRGWSGPVACTYVVVVVGFLLAFAQFYLPGKGFSYLIGFGSNLEDHRLSKVRRLDYHVQRASDGYDAQYYVQIAMDPSLQNRELPQAVDSLPYRARRILFSATAYVLGLGHPPWILQAYAVQNALAWLLLAVVLLRWFPPRDWWTGVRWAGVLFSFGMIVSVRNALIDGPSLLLIAVGVLCVDLGRPWLATLALGLGGLGKETNLLGAASLVPAPPARARAWAAAAGRGLLVALPLGLWLWYLAARLGPVADVGFRNFDWPLAGYARKWGEVAATLPSVSREELGPVWSLAMMVALTVQLLLIALRPRWQEAWWRVGASFAVLMLVLGDAVWEGYPGAASRVLLPMQVAFNVLVPAGRAWRPILLLGNLTLLAAPAHLQPPPGEGLAVTGPAALRQGVGAQPFSAVFDDSWHATEEGRAGVWRWSAGTAAVVLRNPHDQPVVVRLSLGLSVVADREVELRVGEAVWWRAVVRSQAPQRLVLEEVLVPPGESRLEFRTDRPGDRVPDDPRPLATCVHNLELALRALVPPAR